jgi:neurofibromin 1
MSTKSRPYLDGLNLSLAVAIVDVCPASEVDELSMVLFRTFEAKGTLLAFLRVLIEREVSQTSEWKLGWR